MLSRWSATEAKAFSEDLIGLRAYSSRLLGQEPALVQHGGGNTSVKTTRTNLFGETEALLYVKGSGWDLATIQPAGFAPVKMEVLLKMARLETLTDSEMVREQKAAMTNPSAPTPSVEAILHALIPFRFVDHTHSDAVVTLTNTPSGEADARALFGPRVLVMPYVMPGFILARQVFERTQDIDWSKYDAMVLLNHGVFTFHDEAKTAYENMIYLVSRAEDFLSQRQATKVRLAEPSCKPSAVELAQLRQDLGQCLGSAGLLRLDSAPDAVGFANWDKASSVAARGTLTPDHVIHLKPRPFQVGDLKGFVAESHAYFERHKTPALKELDPCPRWGIWPGAGTVSFSAQSKSLRVVEDLVRHTRRCQQISEALGGFKPVSEADLFAVEYWELEQAKLKVGQSGRALLQGHVAVVTGAARGIGHAIAMELKNLGAAVAAMDLNPEVEGLFQGDGQIGLVCDVTRADSIAGALQKVAETFGGVDILVSNAGTFPPSRPLHEIHESDWTSTLDVNLSGHWRVLKAAVPLLKLGFNPSVVVVGSKNVAAPGPGASAYSAAKAGLTQLARVAALELSPFGIRVNTIHPDAVFDTGIWSDEILNKRAQAYGLTVDQYKRKNLLKTEITSQNVAALVGALCGPGFRKTTGAQIPIDGGNDRVI